MPITRGYSVLAARPSPTKHLLLALLGLIGLAGCGGRHGAPAAGKATAINRDAALVIESPHSRGIRDEFDRLWKARHPQQALQWLDQGGTSDDLRFVEGQFKERDKTAGINIDLFFGGGAETFLDLEDGGLLQPLPSTFGVPASLNGVPLQGSHNDWIAAALSGFGMLCNTAAIQRDALPMPHHWADLANPKLATRIGLADPRHSGSAHTAYEVILQTQGWQKGWQVLTAMAGNARTFETAASHLVDDVSTGDAAVVPAIDFYGRAAVARAATGKLLYFEPEGERVVTPDPIAILQGAPHLALAREFVQLVMSPAGQNLWLLKKGAPGGPVNTELDRLPALPAAYQDSVHAAFTDNPYLTHNTRPYDTAKSRLRRRILDDLIGAVLIDNHDALKRIWMRHPDPAAIAFVPVTEDQVAALAPRWSDQTFRQSNISQWQQAAARRIGNLE